METKNTSVTKKFRKSPLRRKDPIVETESPPVPAIQPNTQSFPEGFPQRPAPGHALRQALMVSTQQQLGLIRRQHPQEGLIAVAINQSGPAGRRTDVRSQSHDHARPASRLLSITMNATNQPISAQELCSCDIILVAWDPPGT